LFKLPNFDHNLNLSLGRIELTFHEVVLLSQVPNDVLLENIPRTFLGDVCLEAGHQVVRLAHLQLGKFGSFFLQCVNFQPIGPFLFLARCQELIKKATKPDEIDGLGEKELVVEKSAGTHQTGLTPLHPPQHIPHPQEKSSLKTAWRQLNPPEKISKWFFKPSRKFFPNRLKGNET
jgi:hypothetical protein